MTLSLAPTGLAEDVPQDTDAPALGPSTGERQPGVPPLGHTPVELVEVADSVRNEPIEVRIAAVSEALLQVPYVSDPLGEGQLPDADPLARYDAFDCLTYVEEILALSMAADPAHAAEVRLGLRYGGNTPTYANRHHFMELQWIPQALANGWLRETTATYGRVQVYERQVNAATWAAWSRRSLFELTDEELPTGTMRLEYLSLEDALLVVDQIRPGSVVMTVREDRSWVPIWISHVGFVVPGDEPTIRHATNMRTAMQVRDHGLEWYIRHLMTYKNWKAVGLAIYEPNEIGPRVAALP